MKKEVISLENNLEEFEVVCQEWARNMDDKKCYDGWTIHLNNEDRKSYIKNFRQDIENAVQDALDRLKGDIVWARCNISGPYDGLYLNMLKRKYNRLFTKSILFYPCGKPNTLKINQQAYDFLRKFKQGFWCYNIIFLEKKLHLFRIVCQEFPSVY